MLRIKKSQISNAGLGLWAEKTFERGEKIVLYDGEKITWKECVRRNQEQKGMGGYYLFLSKTKCVDAQHTPLAQGRYANDANGFTRLEGLKNNARYELEKGNVYIIASRNIKPGEEILVSYGRSYWNAMRKAMLKTAELSSSN